MPFFRPSLVLTGILVLTSLPAPAPAADELTPVFAQLDKAAASFRGLTADIRKVKYSYPVPEPDVQTGKIVVRRAKPHELQMRLDLDPPDEQEVVLDGTKVEIYTPKSKSIQPYILGKASKPMAEQLLLLGWGTTSQELRSSFDITFGGQEVIADKKAARLVLIPKDKDLLSHIPKLELWVAQEGDLAGISVQVRFYEKGLKDHSTATYTNIKPQNVSESQVRSTAPKDAVRLKPIHL